LVSYRTISFMNKKICPHPASQILTPSYIVQLTQSKLFDFARPGWVLTMTRYENSYDLNYYGATLPQRHHDIQHNDTKHNDTQHNRLNFDTRHKGRSE